MSEEMVVAKGSPTLAGLKTGNLFTVPVEEKEKFQDSIRRLNAHLVPRGVRLLPVKILEHRALVYVYRPQKLRGDLSDQTARAILARRDYPVESVGRCVVELIRRLQEGEDFPHEVGLFLGYPPEDVEGFIRGSRSAKYTGTWKVYGDVESAKRKFALYRKCTRVYQEAYRRHCSFDRLIVNVK